MPFIAALDHHCHSTISTLKHTTLKLIQRLWTPKLVNVAHCHRLKTLERLSSERLSGVRLCLTPTLFISSLFALQIHRSKNKWKFHLKDGIMNLNGRDYVFSKAIGDAEWWRRGEKKRRSRNSITPSIQLPDTSISFHILRLDLFQETSESLRTLTNLKDCDAP